jgi:hypothetical protein
LRKNLVIDPGIGFFEKQSITYYPLDTHHSKNLDKTFIGWVLNFKIVNMFMIEKNKNKNKNPFITYPT